MAVPRQAATAVLLLLLVAIPSPSPVSGATVAEVIVELKDLQNSMKAKAPTYTVMVLAFDYLIQYLRFLPQDRNIKRFDDKTLLIPSNAAFGPGGTLSTVPKTPIQWIKLASMPTFNALKGKIDLAALLLAAEGDYFPCVAPKRVLEKHVVARSRLEKLFKRGTKVALGRPGKGRNSWAKIVHGDLYKGTIFYAHGSNSLQQW